MRFRCAGFCEGTHSASDLIAHRFVRAFGARGGLQIPGNFLGQRFLPIVVGAPRAERENVQRLRGSGHDVGRFAELGAEIDDRLADLRARAFEHTLEQIGSSLRLGFGRSRHAPHESRRCPRVALEQTLRERTPYELESSFGRDRH